MTLENRSQQHGEAQKLFWSNFQEMAEALLGAVKQVHGEQKQIHKPIEPRVFQRKDITVFSSKESTSIENVSLGRCEREIVKFLAMRQGKFFNKTQVGVMTGYSPNSGGFNNALSKLNTIAYIAKSGSDIGINDSKIEEVISFLGSDYNGNNLNSLEQWLSKLGKCEREIYQTLLNEPTSSYTKDDLGRNTGYSPNSGGFNNAISKLNTLGLLVRNNGYIRLNPELLEV